MQMYHICIFCSERMGRLAEFINKDTQIKNETKRMTVIIRKLCLTFVALSVVNLFLNAFGFIPFEAFCYGADPF